LLVAAEELANHAGFTLIVDAQEFADARLGPRTPLPDHANGSPLPSWQGPLAQADLVLLSTTGTLTVTSRRSADLFRDQLDWIVPDVLAAAVPGTLRRSIEARGDENRFVTGSDWAARGANFDPATAQTVNLGGDGSAAASFLIRADLHDALSVRIAHLPTMSSWRAAGCILALLGCLSYVRRTRSLLALLIGSAAAALVLPASIVPIATGALWGTALALVWTLLSRTAARRRRDEASSSVANSLRRAAVATSLLLAVTLAEPSELVMPAAAQQTKANAAEESTDNIYRVFIPVDEKEQPTDDKYQVPEQLYDELRSRAAKQDGNNDGWLIRSARYQLSLQRADAMSDALVASDVAVRYEIEVFRPDTECRLPLMGVRPGPVIRQEGRETDLEWDIDEDGFLCRFVEAGPYQLELSVRTQRGESTVGSLDMPIPAVPRSALEVQLPTSLPVVEVPSAYGATVSSADGRQLRTDLGPAERLSLRWARPRLGGRSSQTGGEAEQWLWLQVQPASVVLHTRLDIKGMKTPLTELRFSIDPRLRALPVVDRSGTVASVQAVPGDPQSVRVELARPVVDHVTIPVSFLLTGSSGIGQLSLPRVVPQGIRVNERVLAVSVEPALQFESPPVPPEAAVSVTDFLARWGGAPTAPQAVVKLGTDQVWSIATRPRETAHTIKQRLGVSIDEGRAVVRFDAQIIPAEGQLQPTGYVLQYRLTAPPALEVDKISLLQEGIDRVSRWTRDEQGTLTLFLAGPTSGRQQLTLHGWLATPQQGDWELPHIDVDSPGRRDTTVQIWRQPSVLFAVSPQHSLVEAERTRDNEEANLPGRLVAAFVAGQDAFAAPAVAFVGGRMRPWVEVCVPEPQ